MTDQITTADVRDLARKEAVTTIETGLIEQGWRVRYPDTGIIRFWVYPTESGKRERIISIGCNGRGLIDIQEADVALGGDKYLIALQDPVWAAALPILAQFVEATKP